MSVALTALLFLAIATTTGALAFLAGQRASGRTPREVSECHEQATRLDSVRRELDALHEAAERGGVPQEARAELARAREGLEDAVAGLRRGADLLV